MHEEVGGRGSAEVGGGGWPGPGAWGGDARGGPVLVHEEVPHEGCPVLEHVKLLHEAALIPLHEATVIPMHEGPPPPRHRRVSLHDEPVHEGLA